MVRNAMSATEFYILEYLWTRETPATFSEIMNHFNNEEKKEWKKQTVNTFLTRLAQKGFLNIDKSGKRALYIPSVTAKKYYEDYANLIINDSYPLSPESTLHRISSEAHTEPISIRKPETSI